MEKLRPPEGNGERDPLVELLIEKRDHNAPIPTSLFVDGGGAYAAFALGALHELHAQGFDESFDAIYAYSAGALASAAFLGGHMERVEDIVYNHLVTWELASPLRMLQKKDVLNLPHIKRVLTDVLALDTERIQKSKTNFFIGVTDEQGKGTFLDAKELSPQELIRALLASANLPGASNKMVTVSGVRYADGGIGNGVPIDYMLQEGEKRRVDDTYPQAVLAILNSPLVRKREQLNPLVRVANTAVEAWVLSKYHSPSFLRARALRPKVWNETLFDHNTDVRAEIRSLAPDRLEFPLPTYRLRQIHDKARLKTRRVLR